MSSNATPSISIMGATGGTGLSLLRLCLRASLSVTVLVRSPEKLLNLLSLTTAPPNLTIVTGAVQDTSAVRQSLLRADGTLVDIIVSSIGYLPYTGGEKGFSFKPFHNIEDTSLCENTTKTLLASIKALKAESGHVAGKGPLLLTLSTTGISSAGRDIPLLMTPIYWAIATPHKDKKAMEDLLWALPQSEQRWIIIRPSMLGGDGKGEFSGEGKEKRRTIRVGIERGGRFEAREIGYAIRREDVGKWIFEDVVGKAGNGAKRWEGAAVSLTE